jgi:hypothetical protein
MCLISDYVVRIKFPDHPGSVSENALEHVLLRLKSKTRFLNIDKNEKSKETGALYLLFTTNFHKYVDIGARKAMDNILVCPVNSMNYQIMCISMTFWNDTANSSVVGRIVS